MIPTVIRIGSYSPSWRWRWLLADELFRLLNLIIPPMHRFCVPPSTTSAFVRQSRTFFLWTACTQNRESDGNTKRINENKVRPEQSRAEPVRPGSILNSRPPSSSSLRHTKVKKSKVTNLTQLNSQTRRKRMPLPLNGSSSWPIELSITVLGSIRQHPFGSADNQHLAWALGRHQQIKEDGGEGGQDTLNDWSRFSDNRNGSLLR